MDDGKYRSKDKSKQDSSFHQQTEFMKSINYPKEMQRSDFVTHACNAAKCQSEVEIFYPSHSIIYIGIGVTIVIECGTSPCLAILNDIQCKRPVVFVQVCNASFTKYPSPRHFI